ncbi:GNAT family N-acetyltransferase [Breoghania sp. L-A4]|uniref:bifunctional acetate--CoA ligase family protein/GNAT family N-acetyltransferase n=1 Tax=Breoghania sp. L-A4 TaxID=2304600 RepID=UPI000E35FEE0|nr:GNAT family N-acetyltransferase [Breoghania sp. L-A4]AXS39373.1 bifunctional acyl-CoA synthetase/GNAT family N-acetyltransferase [Breoghania sp. L-A4]
MTIRNLDGLLRPTSIALVGPNTIGKAALTCLLDRIADSGYLAPVTLVGFGEDAHGAFQTQASLSDLKRMPDLAILVCGPEPAAELIAQLGAGGTRAALLISGEYETWPQDVLTAVLKAAQPTTLRLVGPGSIGVASPDHTLQAHLAVSAAPAGNLALVARSGAIINATLAWASGHGVGFSHMVSLGERVDVDAADLLDWFAADTATTAVLVHMEAIANARKFLSAARAVARTKPIVVIRSGTSTDTHGLGQTHAGRLANVDAVYEAVFRRAGMLRVDGLDEMFDAVETITRLRPTTGRRLAIVSNGLALATMTADALRAQEGLLAAPGKETLETIEACVAGEGQASNPVVLSSAATGDAYETVIAALLADRAVDGVLIVAAPTALAPITTTAKSIAKAAQTAHMRPLQRKAVLGAMITSDAQARRILEAAGVPCSRSPAEAVRAFMYLARYAEAKKQLMANPPSVQSDFTPEPGKVRAIVAQALAAKRAWLTPTECYDVLAAYGIACVDTILASTAEEAMEAARILFQSTDDCTVKISSPDLPFAPETDGIVVGLRSEEAVRDAAQKLLDHYAKTHPDATLTGVIVQPTASKRPGTDLFAGLADDPVFGPIIVTGQGGEAVEVTGDFALDLAPLDLNLARALFERTRVSGLYRDPKNRAKAEMVALTLVKLSQIAVDIPEIREMDLNPFRVDINGVLVQDVRINVARPAAVPGRLANSRLAIRPYPKEWEQTLDLKDGSHVFVRPVRSEDENLFKAFFEKVSAEDLRLRFFAPVRDFSHAFLARLTQLDYSRAMAFAAFDTPDGELLGAVRLHADPDHKSGEYAILVQSSLKGKGLGWALMNLIIRYAAADGIETITGEVLKENTTMLEMCKTLGFSIHSTPGDETVVTVTLPVSAAAPEAGKTAAKSVKTAS